MLVEVTTETVGRPKTGQISHATDAVIWGTSQGNPRID